MSIFKICPPRLDDLTATLRELFRGANIIRIPNSSIQPLSTFIVNGKSHKQMGRLINMVEGDLTDIIDAIEEARVANIAGKQSRSVDVNFGLEILEGFLDGFGLPSIGIKEHFKGASKVSFSFKDVKQKYIEAFVLGGVLIGQKINTNNSAIYPILERKADLYIIDSIITSSDFSISADDVENEDFEFNVDKIQRIVSGINSKILVESHSKRAITFKGEEPLPFAFTAIKCHVDSNGEMFLRPTKTSHNVMFNSHEEGENERLPSIDGMIIWDED
jgi:hypothetical protein